MAGKKIFTTKTAVWIMLILFLGSVVGGAIEYGIGRTAPKLPGSNIIAGALTEAQAYAIVSQGLVLLKFSIPSDCTFFCETEVSKIEGVVQKYAPYVFLEEIKEGTKMKLDAVTYSGEINLDEVNATAVEDTVCIALPLHPECRRMRALSAMQSSGENSTGNFTNISVR